MDLTPESTLSTYAGLSTHSGTRLHGYLLLLARAIWLAIAAISVGLFVASIPPYYADMLALTNPHIETPEAIRVGLQQLGIPLSTYATWTVAVLMLLAAVFVATGAIIFWRKPDDRGALFFSLTLVVFGATWPNTLGSLTKVHPGLVVLTEALGTWGFGSFFLLFYLFPDGRFVTRWTRWAAIVLIAELVASEHFPEFPLATNNWPAFLSVPFFVCLLAPLFIAPIYRYRRVAGPAERQQIKWVTFSLVVALVSFLGAGWLSSMRVFREPGVAAGLFAMAMPVAFGLMFMPLPISIGMAVLRYRLWDIDPIINRTLVYGALTAIVAGLYILTVGYLGAVFRTEGNLLFSLAATGLIAVLFQPLRERLQRAVNRLMYGERDEPYAVLSRLGERLELAIAPDAVLPTVVETVRDALKLPYAAVAIKRKEGLTIAAASGEPSGEPLRLPLRYQHDTVGELLLSPRAAGEGFNPADRRLLNDLARQAGVAAHAVRLTADLHRSRERLVTAREEERRRLRRDLHDGLGSRLAALNLQAGALRTLIRRDMEAADAAITELRGEIRSAIADIRRLVYGLRPPALDELGLVAAIRQSAARCAPDEANEEHWKHRVEVDTPDHLPTLPAAVEVAAYRIAEEALTNVVRHARASTCLVRLAVKQDALWLEVVDDGVGLRGRTAGVGLLSMRERAAELGGTCTVEAMPDGGTRVLARIPLSEH